MTTSLLIFIHPRDLIFHHTTTQHLRAFKMLPDDETPITEMLPDDETPITEMLPGDEIPIIEMLPDDEIPITEAQRMLKRKAECRFNSAKSRRWKLEAHAVQVTQLQDAKAYKAMTQEATVELTASVTEKQGVIEYLRSQAMLYESDMMNASGLVCGGGGIDMGANVNV
ncbi:hypothetical protein T484DRAFT_1754502 [Baffinella frigidus]|nr:hypothetical protein T484DRAFT_1754502 [Cryptophyta sp. CCMP2293]